MGTQATRKSTDVAPPRISVGFSPADQRKLEQLAGQFDRSVPYIVRKAVRHYLTTVAEPQLALDLGAPDER